MAEWENGRTVSDSKVGCDLQQHQDKMLACYEFRERFVENERKSHWCSIPEVVQVAGSTISRGAKPLPYRQGRKLTSNDFTPKKFFSRVQNKTARSCPLCFPMENNAIASLATLQLPSPCRLLSAACCPDKDLIVLISRLGGHDKLSLWKLQGAKKWEVDVGEDDASATVAALVWSPSGVLSSLFSHVLSLMIISPGQTIAVVRDSAHITLHSVQDGRVERCLSIPFHQNVPQITRTVVGVWWFAGHHSSASGVIPDIFKRSGLKVSCS